MAYLTQRKRTFKPAKTLSTNWDEWKSLNTLLRDSELADNQAKELTNLIIDGKGYITQRPGTGNYHLASANGKVRGLFGSKVNDTPELLAITDDGYLTKKSGASYARITGASYASGYKVRMVQLQNKVYLTQQSKPLTRYDGSALLSYVTVSSPTALRATKFSGATGTYTWSWRAAHTTDAGSTLACDPVTLSNLPEDLTTCTIQLSWTNASAASGLITGTSIYGREQGAETRMLTVQPTTTTFLDDGSIIPSTIGFLPDFNETGGPQAKYIITSVGKLILANITGFKSRVMWSGADNNIGKFHWSKGGGYFDVAKDDGQEITGIVESSENRIIVFKERSIYQVKLSYNSDLGIVDYSIQKISDAVGCVSGDTIQLVENDTWFCGRRSGGSVSLNSLGYQPNIMANVLRTAELSASNRPILETINLSRLEDMWAIFYNQRYWLYYPVSTTMRCLSLDYQRTGWSGPHTFPANPVCGTVYYDSDNKEHYLYGDGDDGYVTEVSNAFSSDKGVAFTWSFTSKKENFGLPFQLKTLLKSLYHLADISGGSVSVTVYLTDTSGNSTASTTFTVTAPNTLAGWGSFPFGKGVRWGSSQQASTSTTNSSDIRKILEHDKEGIVEVQVRITGQCKAKIISLGLQARAEPGVAEDWVTS